MRKITNGVTGGPILGTLTAVGQTISSVLTDNDITLTPNGNGEIQVNSHMNLRSGSNLVLLDNDNSQSVTLAVPADVTSDATYTFPAAGPDAGKFLQTDAGGQLSWVAADIQISNNTTDAATYYPTMTTATSGGITGETVSNTKFSFQPSTGNLTITGQLGGASASFSGNMSAATITETSSITLKENTSPIENALDSVMELAGKIYDRKDGSTKNEAGLIAEEVNKILPNLVKKDSEGNPESIYYTKLSAYLIEAIKTLKVEIDKIKG